MFGRMIIRLAFVKCISPLTRILQTPLPSSCWNDQKDLVQRISTYSTKTLSQFDLVLIHYKLLKLNHFPT